MTDKEMLELAAKAAGTKIDWIDSYTAVFKNGMEWNPLTDDGDRYKLARDLKFVVDFEMCKVHCTINGEPHIFQWGGQLTNDAHAIVFAAAAIGKTL